MNTEPIDLSQYGDGSLYEHLPPQWQCPICEDRMSPKFQHSHTLICRWRERLREAGLWRSP